MKVLLIGSGAREHALAHALARGGSAVHAAPGNPGMARIALCHSVRAEDVAGLRALAGRLAPDLAVVGPEAPLVAGVADALRASGLPVFGPSAAAAQIEGSKAFAKKVMEEAGVPTAGWAEFDDPDQAEAHAASLGRAVIKADGLAAGKGVVVAPDAAQAREAVRALMRGGAVGQAGRRVVIEELLEGEEVSAIAVCDGERYLMFPSAQDHKRLLDGDQGPNTGGMGAISPARALGAGGLEEVGRTIIAPVLARMASRGTPFVGALYAGLMLTAKGPRVLEFNCRFGDPETQVQLLRFRGDLAALLAAAAAGDLRGRSANFSDKACVGVVLAAAGYPSNPVAGAIIEGLEELPTGDELQVFHAGTRLDASGRLTASGGRVLTVCALGDGLTQARERAYQAADAIRFEGRQMRRDIGMRVPASVGNA